MLYIKHAVLFLSYGIIFYWGQGNIKCTSKTESCGCINWLPQHDHATHIQDDNVIPLLTHVCSKITLVLELQSRTHREWEAFIWVINILQWYYGNHNVHKIGQYKQVESELNIRLLHKGCSLGKGRTKWVYTQRNTFVILELRLMYIYSKIFYFWVIIAVRIAI